MDVKLPRLGESAEGGSVVSILVKEGEMVAKGQTLLELESEKAVAPIPAPAAGVIARIRVKEGDRLTVGQVILTLNVDASDKETASPAPGAAKPSAPGAQAVAPESESTPAARPDPGEPISADAPMPAASPEIRRIARELGLDLRRVRGSEAGGRIVMGDLRAYVQRLVALSAPPTPRPVASIPSAPAPTASIDFSQWGSVTRKPLTALRKTISRRMHENWNAIPHVTQFDDADITALMELRKQHAPAYEAKGARLTLTSFALKAVVIALKKHPIFNASLDEAAGEIVFKDYFHLGLAVDTEQGLIVPVIRDVDQKSLLQLSLDVTAAADKARERKVSHEDLKGGTFTISNQGGIGGAHFTPIVNRPEVAILGLGRAALQPVVKDKEITPRLMLPMAVSYDHRVIDGGTAARFTVDLLAAFASFTDADLAL